MKPQQILADKISGFSSTIFGVSIAPDVCVWNNRRNNYKIPFHGVTVDSKKRQGIEWNDRTEYQRMSRALLRSLDARSLESIASIARTITEEADALHAEARSLLPTLRTFDDPGLAWEFGMFIRAFLSSYGLGVFTFVYEETVSEHLTELLRERHPNVGDALDRALTSHYTSYMTQSTDLLHHIARASSQKQRDRMVSQYQHKFFFLDASYEHAPTITPSAILKRAAHHGRSKKTRHHRSTIALSPNERSVVSLLHHTERIRDQRKRICQIGLYVMFRFLDEAVRRHKVPKRLAERTFWFEFPRLLAPTPAFRKKLSTRNAATMVFSRGKSFHQSSMLLRERRNDGSMTTLSGTPASVGIATGTVRIVRGKPDFRAFKPGEILVTEMTRPDFLPIMKHAIAIVTDEGGLTCHAAIVSRELNIPCVVGTKHATQTFKNGDRIEVNANDGVVKKLQHNR